MTTEKIRPGAYRIDDSAGYTIARYIADQRGIVWAHVYVRPHPRARKPMELAQVLELVAAGELELVRIEG